MKKPDFKSLLEADNYDSILEYYPINIADAICTTMTTFSKEFPIGKTFKNLYHDIDEQQLELVYDYFVGKQWSEDNLSIFKNILLDLQSIDLLLQPITDVLGMDYSLSLTGGAIRDLVTGKSKEITDLDIVVNITPPENLTFELMIKEQEEGLTLKDKFYQVYQELAGGMKKLGLDDFVLSSKGTYPEQLYYYIVSSLLSRKINIKAFYPPRHIEQATVENSDMQTFDTATYSSLYLQSVLKLQDNNLHYPVDILLSNVDVCVYNGMFDFNICKVYFNYHDLDINYKQKINKEMNLNDVKNSTEKISYNHDFIQDVIYQRMTFTFSSFLLSQVESSLNKHYPKLEKKYHNYQFYLEKSAFNNCKSSEEYNKKNLSLLGLTKEDLSPRLKDDVKDFVVATVKFNALDKKVPNKEDNSNKVVRPRKI